MLKSTSTIAALLMSATPLMASAQVIDVKITNLTQGIYFTPILATAHSPEYSLFQAGQMASPELQAMAEGGDIAGLVSIADSIGASSQANPAGGLLAPASYTMVTDWDTGTNTALTVVAMLLPTNDGFVGLNSWTIPEQAGTYTVYLNGYDAGTEANDEIVNGGGMPGAPGIPANPGGNGGMGATGVIAEEVNTMIHIHPGNVGDSDPEGGMSDLDSRIHRWLNPVAKLTVTVK
ncbi:hypothetical protein GCM10011369_10220 [Neiella marina]|uniref:Spondin domain-containing protein n=1 Tax=Neiella marina TaxID=508461 RepID=A0A8J2U399_9GAMM|nr:spondin domain-containing protein [Neiella marina]GGA70478.1 hypothetical protein GCM10011369_10220 [Neiella marina]